MKTKKFSERGCFLCRGGDRINFLGMEKEKGRGRIKNAPRVRGDGWFRVFLVLLPLSF
jgi:hypothetical protein